MNEYINYRTFIPPAPIPLLGDLFKLLYHKNRISNNPMLPWCNKDQDIYLFSRGAWAIAAIVNWYLEYNSMKKVRIFLPDYFCNSTLQIFQDKKVNLTFYPICENLNPNWGAIEKLTKESGYANIFILVHYFGFPCGAQKAYEYCQRVGTFLLEDCAHVLFPTEEMGQKGDAAIFSPHKVLGVPDGGLLVLNKKKNNLYKKYHNPESACFFYPSENGLIFQCLIRWVIKKIAQHICMILKIGWKKKASLSHDMDEQSVIGNNRKISFYGRALLFINQKNIKLFINRRRENFLILSKMVLKTGKFIKPLFIELPSNSIPYLFPLLVDEKYVNELYSGLIKGGIPVGSWPDLPPEIKKAYQSHKTANTFRQSLVTLPIHHSLYSKHIMYIGRTLNDVVKNISDSKK